MVEEAMAGARTLYGSLKIARLRKDGLALVVMAGGHNHAPTRHRSDF